METLSFVLGIAFVVVIVIAVVATYAFFKVINIKEQVKEIDLRISNEVAEIYQRFNDEYGLIQRRIDELERGVYSELDSRLDKLENKLTNKK